MDAADVLIIGGGLIGCAAAWHLARAGTDVLLVERGELNAGASGQNAGSLHFQIERRFLEHGDALADQAARTVALSRLAIAEWRDLPAALGDGRLDVAMQGGLMVAQSDDEVRLLERKAALEARWGLPTELIDGTQARAIAPYLADDVRAASFLADEGHANPRLVTRALADAAASAGARLLPHTALRALVPAPGGWRATLRRGADDVEVAAAAVLIAAGAWTMAVGALAGVHLPVFPIGLQMNVTERVAPFLPHLVQHVGRRLSMKQAHDGNVLIGGGWPSRLARGEGGFDLARAPMVLPDSLTGNLAVAAATVPRVGALNLIRTWTGVVAITADQLPLAGAVPGRPGLFVIAGGSGFTLGPTLARAVSAEMLGRSAGDAAAAMALVAPARFAHLNAMLA
ncbi:FAD-binding oxidoreductase [Sphingomonas yunnanensis]|uniref:NAD(P)/FAD-dependent oxidoreductase n=1 Tax=Sphingomonas yunnanensis TaxID=310400 RepID=UPI001CA6E36F|nr:FAD-binding oxidoreductase [Sphingomonas yunnanensis]MBY9063575.1 FAD-binding oxidoreductase [Sphingomonas yunnanensis]